MSAMQTGRPYMSIGEVLNVLKDEFPDVTVSKIRFLESEGLIQPERTPSGYRKFSHIDVERLRFILRQQRDHFLPLKVIRERVAEWEASADTNGAGQPSLLDPPPAPKAAEAEPRPEEAAAPEAPPAAPERVLEPGAIQTGLSLSAADLAHASGLEEKQIGELRSFGLLEPRAVNGDEPRYTETDLEVAKLCRDLLGLGLEVRHLRLFKSSVDRWASLAEQMVLPLIKQRNPEARQSATQTVRELVRLGNKLTQALLREALSSYA